MTPNKNNAEKFPISSEKFSDSLWLYISHLQVFFFSFFGLIAWEILVPEAGTEPTLPALGAQSLNHGTTREVPHPEFSIKSMLSVSKKLGNRRQYLSVNNVAVCFFHLQLLWNFTTRNKKQHIGSVCYFQIVCFVFTAQNSLLILITTNH